MKERGNMKKTAKRRKLTNFPFKVCQNKKVSCVGVWWRHVYLWARSFDFFFFWRQKYFYVRQNVNKKRWRKFKSRSFCSRFMTGACCCCCCCCSCCCGWSDGRPVVNPRAGGLSLSSVVRHDLVPIFIDNANLHHVWRFFEWIEKNWEMLTHNNNNEKMQCADVSDSWQPEWWRRYGTKMKN